MAATTGNIWVDAAVGVAAYALLYKRPLGYEAEAFAAYQEALAIPSRRATDIAKIQQMLSLAQQAGDQQAVQTIQGYLTALGANPATGGTPSSGTPSSSPPSGQTPTPSTPQGTSPAASFAACSQGEYQQGSTGACVMLIQRTLNQLAAQGTIHLTNAPLSVDGIFGPETDAAVRQFQQQEGIQVDGIVGPQTWGKLQNPTPAPSGSSPNPNPSGSGLTQTYQPVPPGSVPFLSCPSGYFHQVFYTVQSPFFQTHEGIWTACLPAVPSNLKGLPGVQLNGFQPETWLSLGPVQTVQGGGAPLSGPIYGVAQYDTASGQLQQVYLQTNNPGAKGTLLGGGQGFVQLP